MTEAGAGPRYDVAAFIDDRPLDWRVFAMLGICSPGSAGRSTRRWASREGESCSGRGSLSAEASASSAVSMSQAAGKGSNQVAGDNFEFHGESPLL